MNDDLRQELNRLKGAQDRKATEALTAAWRRLRALRDGLAKELEKAPKPLETDVDVIEARLRKSYKAQVDAAEAEAKKAEEELKAFEQEGKLARLLSREWRANHKALVAKAAEKRQAADTLAADLKQREEQFHTWAVNTVRENHQKNIKAQKPFAPLRERLAKLDLALAAVKAGDGAASACLLRWDLEMLDRVADIWKRIRDVGFVSPLDYAFYREAARLHPDQTQGGDNAVLIRRTTEEVVVLPRNATAQQPQGPIVDGEYTEVWPEEFPAIEDQRKS